MNNCCCNDCLWILILMFCCGGCGCGCGSGCSGCNIEFIIWLYILSCCCGKGTPCNNGGFGCK